MSFIKIYDTNRLEFQKDVYKRYISSIFWTPNDDDYIPSWYLTEDQELDSLYLQQLNVKQLENKVIQVDSSILLFDNPDETDYTYAYANSMYYADKQTKSGFAYNGDIYRLRIELSSPTRYYYSEIFKQIS
jgi:hypothetical protein